MKKLLSCSLVVLLILLSACSSNNQVVESQTSEVKEVLQSTEKVITESNVKDIESIDSSEINYNFTGDKKDLIIYFNYAENIDTSKADVDAISSASLGRYADGSGKNNMSLMVMVDEIKNKTNADTFSIQINELYEPKYDDMVNVAREDQNNNKQFTFKNELTNLDEYDTIYFGAPVWWSKWPQPVKVFLEKYDFSGKIIIPFGINLGSGFGQMLSELKELEPNAKIENGITISASKSNDAVRTEIKEFLK